MKWITRERPKIDRIACPWLILRFIDRDAEFLYVPAPDVLRKANETGATPYDIPGVEMSHVGELCSFDAFLAKYIESRCEAIRVGYLRLAMTCRLMSDRPHALP